MRPYRDPQVIPSPRCTTALNTWPTYGGAAVSSHVTVVALGPPARYPYKSSKAQACRERFNRPESPGTILLTYSSVRMKLPAFYLLGAIIKIPKSLISSTQYTIALPGRPTAGRRSLAMHPSGVTSDSELSRLAVIW
ncbi:hypothetical protein FOMPIDRAFT_82581 [Fomitopsis schrenkii]|uniref:Uncharacterized protein n=1 Tax=Fomitopsis schrenkii TaxID=2126942 RepID=S8EBV4_FOMSC|nr:hypothetical protein FOMPIDRAFT_82581 [Fomitopsis schrenkii]